MTEQVEIELNRNVRAKIARRENSWSKVGCECGGLTRYNLSTCFRPGGNACSRRARRHQ